MPNESLSVYLTAVDGMSPVFASITDKTRALDKESQELAQTYEALQKANKGLIAQKTELQKKLQEVNEEVRAAKKQLNELGDEASSDAFNKAVEKQQALKNEIAGTTKALQENQKIYKENIETARKNALGGGGQGTSLNDMAKGIVAGQIGQMFASSLGGLGQSLLTSAVGTPTASLISDALSSAISGGAAGAMFGPLGMAIGAALGGVSGLISGGTKIFEAKDDAFKDYYGGLYDDVKDRSGEMVEAGSTIAGSREQTRIAFEQKLGGEKQAAEYLARVEEMAANTNYDYDEIVGYTKSLLNTYDAGRVLDVLQTLSDASGGLGLDSSDVSQLIQGLYMLRSSDTANSQYLKSFTTRGVDTNQAIADYLNEQAGWEKYGKNDVTKLISGGKVSGEDAAQAILDYIDNNYGGLSILQSETYDAMVDNLGDITASLQAKGGDAYNELRKEGMQAELNALGGDGGLGDAIGEINRIMGENQAMKENLQEQYMREVKAMVLEGQKGELWDKLDASQQNKLTEMSQQYAELMARYKDSGETDWEAAVGLQKLYEVTEATGQAYFDNSDFMKTLTDTEIDEIQAILDNTAALDNATQANYRVAQALSKGFASAYVFPKHAAGVEILGDGSFVSYGEDGGVELLSSNPYADQGNVLPDGTVLPAGLGSSHAFGLGRVPYDDYPALLHRDERVLTASEARAQDAGQGTAPASFTITGNNFIGTPEEFADQIWEIIVRKLERAYTAAAPK